MKQPSGDPSSRFPENQGNSPRRYFFRRTRPVVMFFFFMVIFGLIPLLITAGFALLALTQPFFFPEHHLSPERPVGLVCGGAAGLAIGALVLSRWARRRVADPLAGILEATEKVTEGDLSARVEVSRGPFANLEGTFNHMLDELEQTDRQRRNLTADVAHELNTPLHIIQGYLEGIADGIYQPDEATINTLLDETQLLSRLVEDLRTLSLAEGGELHLKRETLSMDEFLADIKTSFSGQSAEAGIDLQVETPPGLTVNADPDRLDQIVSNLVVNALRHTPSGGEVRISASKITAASGSGVQLVVADTGEGISPEDLPQIFNRFWRKDKSRERPESGGGHGLGLAIAQQLVHAHGGTITAESELGKGTTFTIQLFGE